MTRYARVLASVILIGLAATATSAKPLARAQMTPVANALGTKLLVKLHAATPNETIAVSPVSLGQTLAMLAAGASGSSRREFSRLFGTRASEASMRRLARDAATLQRALGEAGGVEVTMSNALWLDRSVALNRRFRTAGIELYKTALGAPGAVGEINAWVAGKTKNRIKEIIDDLPRQIVFVAVDALYFRGRWEEPFDAKATRAQPFARADGTRLSVPMMHKADTFDYAEDSQAQSVALPFVGAGVELRLVLPRQGQTLPVDAAKAAAWLNAARDGKLEERPGRITMPRLKLEWGGDLVEPLRAAGLSTALGSSGDFRALTRARATVGEVAHRVVFEADEEGAVGAAATAAVGTRSMSLTPPFEMTIDRPFFLFVRDRRTGAVLFQALVADPGTAH